MECPYCHTEMQEGFLQSARPVFWGLRRHKLFFGPGEGEVQVSAGVLNGAFKEAHYCPACKKIIVSL